MWDYRILYADRSSEDEKLSKGHFLPPPPPKENHGGQLEFKILTFKRPFLSPPPKNPWWAVEI
jgi:hypothetical protein